MNTILSSWWARLCFDNYPVMMHHSMLCLRRRSGRGRRDGGDTNWRALLSLLLSVVTRGFYVRQTYRALSPFCRLDQQRELAEHATKRYRALGWIIQRQISRPEIDRAFFMCNVLMMWSERRRTKLGRAKCARECSRESGGGFCPRGVLCGVQK